jgi:hypothetical protein
MTYGRSQIITAHEIRSLGGLLQILAVLEVFREITRVDRVLNPTHQPALIRFGQWVLERIGVLHRRQPAVTRNMSDSAGATDAITRMSVKHGSEADLSVRERLDRHAQRLQGVEQQLEHLGTTLADSATAQNQKLLAQGASLRQRIQDETDELRALIRAASGDGLRLRWWAASVLVLGIALTTWPAGIAHSLNSL